MVDKKGAFIYVVAALALSYGYVVAVTVTGLLDVGADSFLPKILLLVFLVTPALAALIAKPFSQPLPGEPPALKPGSMRRVLGVALFPFIVTILIHVVISVFNFAQPDWRLGKALAGIEPYLAPAGQSAAGAGGQYSAVMLVLVPILSVILGATFYALLALGTELGFRRFLQPRLLRAYDRPLAYTMSALAFILWLAPLYIVWRIQISSDGTGVADARATAPRLALLMIALTVLLGEVQRRSGSTGLAAIFMGSFFAQSSYYGVGMWSLLYSQVYEPWTGTFGWISVVTWCLVALIVYVLPSQVDATQRALARDAAAKADEGPKVRPKARPRAEA